jgi:hypothetical protein
MAFVRFEQPDGEPTWVNAELVSFVRPSRKGSGEAGQTCIWMEGAGVYVKTVAQDVIRALGGDNGASQVKSSS